MVIATATLVEDTWGTAIARRWIYGTLWFKLVWAAIAASGLAWVWQQKLWRRMPIMLLHVSFLVILAGALVTSFTGKKGTLHLRQGIPCTEYLSEEDVVERLPFMVRLDSFHIEYYPGTQTPLDYVSQITGNGQSYTISMNRIAQLQGYRFYQSSYDGDLQGSILSVNHDPLGTTLTYLGYALLALSMMWTLASRWLQRRRGVVSALLLTAFCLNTQAEPLTLDASKAATMERGQVMWNDRVAPLGTLTHDFLLKVYGSTTYHGLTSTQVVTSWALSPQEWSQEPIIKIKDKALRQQLGLEGKYACLQDLFDEQQEYRLDSQTPTRSIMEVDEKVGLIMMLLQGTLIKPVPKDVEPLTDQQIDIELLYNRIDWTLWGMIGCFLLALAGLIAHLIQKRWARMASAILGWGNLAFLLAGFFLRWSIARHLPLSNGYETMMFVAISLLAIALVIRLSLALPALCAALMLLVAHLGEINPQITQLMPVLHSPWLSAHVSIIMMSYAMLILSFANRKLLEPAIFLLAAGIFLGAVWANVSWGTYWSWDPKESWALVTLLVYSLPLHQQSLPWFRSQRHYRLYSLLALACLLMTYFGVNYLLGGMHSYAGN